MQQQDPHQQLGRQCDRDVREPRLQRRRRHQNDVPRVLHCRRQLQQQAPQEQQFIGQQFPPQVDTYRVGKMDVVCQFCGAYRF